MAAAASPVERPFHTAALRVSAPVALRYATRRTSRQTNTSCQEARSSFIRPYPIYSVGTAYQHGIRHIHRHLSSRWENYVICLDFIHPWRPISNHTREPSHHERKTGYMELHTQNLPHLAQTPRPAVRPMHSAHAVRTNRSRKTTYTCTFSALGLRLDDSNVFEIFGWFKRAIGVGHDPPLRIP